MRGLLIDKMSKYKESWELTKYPFDPGFKSDEGLDIRIDHFPRINELPQATPDTKIISPYTFSFETFMAASQFKPEEYQVYHGTSIEALDAILASKRLRTPHDLHRTGELVYGEMKQQMDARGDSEMRGEKYLHPSFFDKHGITIPEKTRRELGHAYAVFFSGHPVACLGYTPQERERKAILGINKTILEDYGYTLIDCQGEGVKCERNIPLERALQVLLVPDERVDEYRKRTRTGYFLSVYPLSDLNKVSAGLTLGL